MLRNTLTAAWAAFALVAVGLGAAGPAMADPDDTAEGGLSNGSGSARSTCPAPL